MNRIKIYNLVKSSRVLGEGKRFVIWTQGCLKQCKGCFTPDAQTINGGKEYDIKRIVDMIRDMKDLDGVTISGGEPFLQKSSLLRLINEIKYRISGMSIIVYTGYRYDELISKGDLEVNDILNSIDLLIDGEYIEEMNEDTPLVGSTNQEVIILSDKGVILAESMQKKIQREIEINIDSEFGVSLIGIPPQRQKDTIIEKCIL